MDNDEIRRRVRARGFGLADVGRALGIDENKVSKSLSGIRRWQAVEMDALRALLADPEDIAADAPRSIPIIGSVTAGNWREAIKHPVGRLPLPDPSVPPRAFALKVDGDSMDLHVPDGATIIVDPDDRALFPNRLYVVKNGEGETTFKQFRADPARLVPCSSNPEHKDILIGAEGFEIIARVIWQASRL
jgi:SOS-response transcriptional repressor LexA